MGDYFEIMSGGWFKADATIPGELTVMTAGWFSTPAAAEMLTAVIGIVPIVHHQHLSLAGRGH